MFSIEDFRNKKDRIDELTATKLDLSILLSLVELEITRKKSNGVNDAENN